MMKPPVLNNTPMQVYTQITKPAELNGDDIWIPCMKTYTVDHDPATPQGLIITHIESVNHYKHSLKNSLRSFPEEFAWQHSQRLEKAPKDASITGRGSGTI